MENKINQLKEKAREIRIDIVSMLYKSKSGHPGGSLSAADFIAALYFDRMRLNKSDFSSPAQDRFVLSKGHAAPALYSALARSGYFPVEELSTLRKFGSRLQGHPDLKAPGVFVATGSLGNGFSQAVGIALAQKLDGLGYNTYCVIGDGECQEGIIWEAAMSAAHYNLDNLCAIVDYNGLQIDGSVSQVMEVAPLADKWRAFGFEVFEIDGHDIAHILEALEAFENVKGKPTAIIGKTVKGKGVKEFEGKVQWHGVAPKKEEYIRALQDLGANPIEE